MKPDPLYMLMKNMSQRPHGPRPYDGILGAQQEKVVAYEGNGAGDMYIAVQEAVQWVLGDTYTAGDVGTLIEIRVVGTIQKADGKTASFTESTTDSSCSCTSGRICEPCINA